MGVSPGGGCWCLELTDALQQLKHTLITIDLLNQNPKKKVMLLYKKLFQLDVTNGYPSRVLNTIITDEIVIT